MDSSDAIFIEEIGCRVPLFYKPFSINGSRRIETLNLHEAAKNASAIIEERGGLHFINQSLLLRSGLSDQELNAEFKKLVDSIIG